MRPRTVEVLPFVFAGNVASALFPEVKLSCEWPWGHC